MVASSARRPTAMQLKCPHCGAPPPHPVSLAAGPYTCPYCGTQSFLGQNPPPPPPVAPFGGSVAPAPRPIVVVHAPHFDHDPAPARAARASWIIWVVVVVFVSGGAGAFRLLTKSSSFFSALVWSGDEPLECSGVEEISVSGVEASFPAGPAIIANGNCRVKCTDCTISAPTAIEAGGNAQVTIVNGTVRGGNLLANASGNAHVSFIGHVTTSGRIQQSANAVVSK